jgi:hypothetical protein
MVLGLDRKEEEVQLSRRGSSWKREVVLIGVAEVEMAARSAMAMVGSESIIKESIFGFD